MLIVSSSTTSIILSPYWYITTDNSFLIDGLIHIHFVFLLLVISLFYRFRFSALLDSRSSPGPLYLTLIHSRCKSSKCFGMLNIWTLWSIFHLLFKQFCHSTQKVQTSRKADYPLKLTNCSLYHCRPILKIIHETPQRICSIVTGFLIGQSAWWLKLLPKSNHLFLLPPEPLCKISIQPVHNILSKIKQKVKQTNTTEKHNLPGKGNKYLNISTWLISSIVSNGIVRINSFPIIQRTFCHKMNLIVRFTLIT